jgi:excisionase family DNA binding protein
VEDLLTTKQLQTLLQVDRITIYRMLHDGRLPGFKVGGQWRFSRQKIEQWLDQQRVSLHEPPPLSESDLSFTAHALPLSCVETMQSVFAEALDIAAVTIDPDGTPLTEVSNACEFCDLILSSDEGRRRCESSWTATHATPQPCHAGLLCVSAPVHVAGQPVAYVTGCQFVAVASGASQDPHLGALSNLATDLDLSEVALRSAVKGLRSVPEPTVARIHRLLLQVAKTFSQIGEERRGLLHRLQRIAEITNLP